jgi:hypothetical protein
MNKREINDPFLFQFLESELYINRDQKIEEGTYSNPIEEEPTPEPTKKGPWGD